MTDMSQSALEPSTGGLSRRAMLGRAAGGFGSIALAGMLADEARADGATGAAVDPLAPREPHFPPRATNVIFMFSTGGASHVDTFDYRPQLFADHGKTVTIDNWQGKLGEFKRFLKRPDWNFRQYGESGTWVSDLFPHLGQVIDEVCILNSVEGDHTGHDKATMGMHTGSFNFARPGIGSWVSYGLGTENRNLPSFMVLAPAAPYAGAQVWGSDFLPGCHQGTHVLPGPNPLPNVKSLSPGENLQRLELALRDRFNSMHLAQRPGDAALEARIRSFETAFGMQREAPEAFDIGQETEATLQSYGLKPGDNKGFGWQCLVARRLIERAVAAVSTAFRWRQSSEPASRRNRHRKERE